jgi:5-methylcytosine-specific restriction endonuclease McrA
MHSIFSADAEPNKACGTCGETQPSTAFNKDSRAHDGRNYYCRDCLRAKRQINWALESLGGCRKKDKQRWGQNAGDFGEQIPLKRIHDLLVMQQKRCMYCNVVMLYGLGIDRRTHPRAVTIERADNDVPHTTENCVLACQSCNQKRGASYTYEGFMEHHANIKLNLVKKCQNECGRILPITSFHKKNQRHHSACKSCRRHQTAKPY